MPCAGGQDTQEEGSFTASLSTPWPHLVTELGMEEIHALPWLLVLSFSIGKFYLHSNSSPCCCPAALISFLFFLGNLRVTCCLHPRGLAWGGGVGGQWSEHLSLCPVRLEQEGLWSGEAHTWSPVLCGSLGPQCWLPASQGCVPLPRVNAVWKNVLAGQMNHMSLSCLIGIPLLSRWL